MTGPRVEGGRLVVCPTPIGNLADITLRAIEALREADLIACEDTRRTRLLLHRYEIPGGASRLVSLHEHNEFQRAGELASRIQAGAHVALVSDAGMPLLSDPGFVLLQACLRRSIPVTVLPGPSAVTAAVVASGLPAQGFRFVGFLPRAPAELEDLLSGNAHTLVCFDSPRRLAGTLALLARLDPARPVAVCRELSKLHEEVRRGPAAELAAHYGREQPRGEIALVVGSAPAGTGDARSALDALRELVAAGARPRPAARVLARLTGTRANDLYRALNEPDPPQ